MVKTLFLVIIVFIVFDFIIEQLLAYLNSTRFSEVLPEEVKGIYDEKEYIRSQQYLRLNNKFSILSDSVSFIILLAVLFFSGFGWLDHVVRQWSDNEIWQSLYFFGIIAFVSDIISTPFSVYHTFVIESKFGFNKTTLKTFVLDKIKGWIIGIIIGGGLLALIVFIFQSTGQWFWILAWGLITLFSIFMSMFYSNLIVPLFNKQKPLEEGDLRTAIEEFSKKAGFKLKDIYVIDGSKRSAKANAYFTGFGPKKRIVLYDTLIENHSIDELVAVLAHEIGHYKKKHILTGMAMGIVQTGIMLFIFSIFISNPILSQALGAAQGSFHVGALAFGILYSPVMLILEIATNAVSRKHEFAADRYAALNFNKQSLKEALKKLSVKNLSNLRPHPSVVFVKYSHPPLLARLAAIDQA
ncbi:MAG: M48 family metallopeptidase [Bacteroidales bacterium]|nr:M48 family metallopeptidase [Bacteroidales bacterium]MDI9592321.1 M48 family metallopeptidase [Bacteroidota bacterium]HOF80956.1 M48 family metallopeptidase [Bacteroidales bacterium]HOR76266.1 M48 family metallopeptidase [Bacteroidales bacterium]HPL11673.1 M48 family metallopeptidase [Bacteroidales bacterium]